MYPCDPNAPNLVEGHIMVGFKPDVSQALATAFVEKQQLKVLNFISDMCLVEVPVGEEEKWIEFFQADPSVEYAEREGICHTMAMGEGGGNFMEEGPHPLPGMKTTMALGEEGGGKVRTCGTKHPFDGPIRAEGEDTDAGLSHGDATDSTGTEFGLP
jgi:hypothetical protein